MVHEVILYCLTNIIYYTKKKQIEFWYHFINILFDFFLLFYFQAHKTNKFF